MPVRLGQLIVEKLRVSLPVQLILLLQEPVPHRVPFWTETGDRLQCAKPDSRPSPQDGVRHSHERTQRRRLVPVRQGLSWLEESRVITVCIPSDLVTATEIRRFDGRYHTDRGILE